MENLLLTALAVVVGLIVVVGLGIAAMVAFKLFQIKRVAKNTTVHNDDPLLADLTPNQPALVYFTAEWCGPCRLTQTPIIEKLRGEYADSLQVLKVDMDEHPDAARRWGVMSAPRTFVLTPQHAVHSTNLAVADYGTLKGQIDAVISPVAATHP